MKRGVFYSVLFMIMVVTSCNRSHEDAARAYDEDADYVQIVLFHLEKRCESCNAVERETEYLLTTEYSEEVESKKVCLVSLNIQSENGIEAARKLRASGQSLFVVSKDSAVDLTSAGFMFASTHPHRYHKSLRETLDLMLD